jgi:hypothetical protein
VLKCISGLTTVGTRELGYPLLLYQNAILTWLSLNRVLRVFTNGSRPPWVGTRPPCTQSGPLEGPGPPRIQIGPPWGPGRQQGLPMLQGRTCPQALLQTQSGDATWLLGAWCKPSHGSKASARIRCKVATTYSDQAQSIGRLVTGLYDRPHVTKAHCIMVASRALNARSELCVLPRPLCHTRVEDTIMKRRSVRY